jgi:transcriptional regulator
MTRGDIEDNLPHAIRSAEAAGQRVEVIPARCKACNFVFGEDKLTKPSRCPACRGSRLHEPMLRLRS